MDPSPTEIGEYKLIRQLGRGGMGEVFLAEDRGLDRKVAIKVIAGFRDHPDARARFAVEARAIGRLKHPNVVTVHRVGEVDGRPYLVSEYVEGTPLDRLARPIDRDRAIDIGTQLARGLAAAHREGILHRDVKPANAIVGDDGVVKLLDFGLAKLAGSAPSAPLDPSEIVTAPARPHGDLSTITFTGSPALPGSPLELTGAGVRLGTPRYMSPEAWQGKPLTAASDVYSLGLVLWELIAGRHPFAELDGEQLAARVGGEDVPSIASTGVSPRIAAAIDRCGKCRPGERHVDAVALLAALEPVAAEPIPEPPRNVWAAAGLGVIAAAGGIAFLSTRGEPERPTVVPAAPTTLPAATVPVFGPPAPRAITALGGCSDQPGFVDGATVVFTLMKGDDVDLFATTGSNTPTPFARSKGWDNRAIHGRHPGEVLYVRDGKDQFEVVAHDRASSVDVVLGNASSAAPIGDRVYAISDELPGQLGVFGDGKLEPFAKLPAGKSPYLITSAEGSTKIAIVVADPESPPGLCVVDTRDRSVTCPPTDKAQNGRFALTRDGRYLYYPARAGIRRLDLSTTEDRVVVAGVRASGGLTLSPDQRRLVYSDCRSYGSLIAVATTGDARPESVVGRGQVRHPAPGPDGLLAWVEPNDSGGNRVVLRGRDGKERELFAADSEIGRAAIDPAGARIAFAIGGGHGGVRVLSLAGGSAETWSTSAADRGPVFVTGGVAFTRRGAGGVPSAVMMTAPTAAPRELAKGWLIEDVDRTGTTLLVSSPGKLATVDVSTGTLKPITLGKATGDINGARIAPDGTWYAVLAGPTGGTLYRVDRSGKASVIHEAPPGQTVGQPAFLSDGRIVFRPEIWLGELYELPGEWATPAQ